MPALDSRRNKSRRAEPRKGPDQSPVRNPAPYGARLAKIKRVSRSGNQMLAEHVGALFLQQLLEDLLVGESLVDLLRQDLAYLVGHGAGIGVATGQREEVSG